MGKHFVVLIFVLLFTLCEPIKGEAISIQPDSELSETAPLLTPSPSEAIEKSCWRESENRYIHAGLTDWICNYCGEYVEPRYRFTDDDIYILAQLLCGDANYDGDGEYDFVWGAIHDKMNYYEMSKVLCVVMNRVRDGRFPNTVSDVIFQKGQFAGYRRIHTNPHSVALEKIKEWCDAYDRWDPGIQSIPENHLYFEAGPNLTNITKETWR